MNRQKNKLFRFLGKKLPFNKGAFALLQGYDFLGNLFRQFGQQAALGRNQFFIVRAGRL